MAEKDPSTSDSGITSVNYGSVEVPGSSAEPPHPKTTHYVDCGKEGTLLARKNQEVTDAPNEEQRTVTAPTYPYAALAFIFVSNAVMW